MERKKTLTGYVNILNTEWLTTVHCGSDVEGMPVAWVLPALQWRWSHCACPLCAGYFTVLLITHSVLFSQAPYVKVYLLDNGVCIAKKKTKVARKTLEPLYQQLLSFEESPQGRVLQVRVHGWPLTQKGVAMKPHCKSSISSVNFFPVRHGWNSLSAARQWPVLYSCSCCCSP